MSYDSWKTSPPDGDDSTNEQCSRDCEGCPDCTVAGIPLEQHDITQPLPGTWAFTARMMAQGDASGFDWDRWKDEMKEREWEEENG